MTTTNQKISLNNCTHEQLFKAISAPQSGLRLSRDGFMTNLIPCRPSALPPQAPHWRDTC